MKKIMFVLMAILVLGGFSTVKANAATLEYTTQKEFYSAFATAKEGDVFKYLGRPKEMFEIDIDESVNPSLKHVTFDPCSYAEYGIGFICPKISLPGRDVTFVNCYNGFSVYDFTANVVNISTAPRSEIAEFKNQDNEDATGEYSGYMNVKELNLDRINFYGGSHFTGNLNIRKGGNLRGYPLSVTGKITMDKTCTKDGWVEATEGIDIVEPEVTPVTPKPSTPEEPVTPGTPGKDGKIAVSKVTISGKSKVAPFKKITLTAKVSPSNATNKKVTWKSGNTKYATVTSKGVVKAKKAGAGRTVTITATVDGKKATKKIAINGLVKKITIKGKASVKAGKSLKLKTTIKAGKNANKKLKWTSSNKKFATVSAKGVVKTKKAGKGRVITITAKATDGSGKKASKKIRILK